MSEKPSSPFFKRSHSLAVTLFLFLFLLSATLAGQSDQNYDSKEPMPPEQALRLLAGGNLRYLSHNSKNPPDYERERRELINGQKPYGIVLSCSDSRVPPEIVFDETLGNLFVIRVAGNVTGPTGLGSIEYAVDHRYSRLLFVMAHESCGAVEATMDAVRTGKYPASPNLRALINPIIPTLDRTKLNTKNKKHVAVNVDRNLQAQMANVVKGSAFLAGKVRSGELQIIGAIYSLEKGDAKPVYYYDKSTNRVKPIPPAKAARPN
ncbi:MAG: carbonic anhydrase [Acidobacteria bacterium]|nr:MAG: carbonic anhydrase [Acidobacteriota bacterium]